MGTGPGTQGFTCTDAYHIIIVVTTTQLSDRLSQCYPYLATLCCTACSTLLEYTIPWPSREEGPLSQAWPDLTSEAWGCDSWYVPSLAGLGQSPKFVELCRKCSDIQAVQTAGMFRKFNSMTFCVKQGNINTCVAVQYHLPFLLGFPGACSIPQPLPQETWIWQKSVSWSILNKISMQPLMHQPKQTHTPH